jgi:hypothetical protein
MRLVFLMKLVSKKWTISLRPNPLRPWYGYLGNLRHNPFARLFIDEHDELTLSFVDAEGFRLPCRDRA